MGLYLDYNSIPLDLFSIFVPEVCCLDHGSFVVSFQIGMLGPSPVLPYEVSYGFSHYCKKDFGILMGLH